MSAELRTFIVAVVLFAVGFILDLGYSWIVKPAWLVRVLHRASLVAWYMATGLILLVIVTWTLRALHVIPPATTTLTPVPLLYGSPS